MRRDRSRLLHRLLFPLLMIWYVLVVAGLVAVVTTWPHRPIGALGEIPWWSHVTALVLVVATWVPVAAHLERGVHHLAYGQRDDAYDAAGRVVAQLRAGPRPDGLLSAADLRLLDDLGRHVAITLHAARLTTAVQHSREQLVTAREEERRRIRRDLHDGLAPTLAALGLQLGVLQRTLRADPDGAESLAGRLRADVRQATGDIRRLVYDLRPPMLDEFGLADALRSLPPADGPRRTVDVPADLPALPAAVEVAIYRIVAEALHNTARHAAATRCAVALDAAGDAVTVTISDDGRGLPEDYLAEVGHLSMRERCTELGGTIDIGPAAGGGTRVSVTFPVRSSHV